MKPFLNYIFTNRPKKRFKQQIWLGLLLVLGFSLALINFPLNYPARSLNNPTEIRGVWLTNIDSEVLFKPQNINQAIASLSQLNFNTLYPTVWNWGYTLYPSQVAKNVTGQSLDPAEGLQGRDILKEMVAVGHQKKMAVVPWFEFGFMAPADSALAQRHSKWLTQRQDGSEIWLEGNVHQRVWLNPLHPEVQQFITDLIVEIVKKYDIDGIQFDDHFGFPSDFGYDDFTVNLYQQEHRGKLPPNDYQDREWIRWRADKITAYMKQLFQSIKATNPTVLVSLSPNPQEFSLDFFLLDWHRWERMGLIEELVLQVYRSELSDFQRELAQPELHQAKAHIPVAIGILSGLKGRPIPIKNLKTQVEIVRNQGFSGVSFFFYESLWNLSQELPTTRKAALRSLFSTPVKRPNVLKS